MEISWNIKQVEIIDSTNQWLAKELSDNPNISEGYGIFANFQSTGMGQRNNSWESETHQNILLSFLLKPGLPVERQFLLSQLISLAVAEYLIDKEDISEAIKIKWPNDIYIGDKKIAGILIQNILQGKTIRNSIVGIGLNLNQKDFYSAAPNPISLSQLTQNKYDIHLESILLLEKVNKYYSELFKVRKAKFQNMYRFLLYRLNEKHSFLNEDGEEFTGVIKGVNDDGKLAVERFDGIEHFDFQEIKYLI